MRGVRVHLYLGADIFKNFFFLFNLTFHYFKSIPLLHDSSLSQVFTPFKYLQTFYLPHQLSLSQPVHTYLFNHSLYAGKRYGRHQAALSKTAQRGQIYDDPYGQNQPSHNTCTFLLTLQNCKARYFPLSCTPSSAVHCYPV